MLENNASSARTAAEYAKAKTDKLRRNAGANMTQLSVYAKGTPDYGRTAHPYEMIALEHMTLRTLTFISPVRRTTLDL